MASILRQYSNHIGFTLPGGREFLIPAQSPRLASKGMLIYNARSTKARLLHRAVRLTISTEIGLRLFKQLANQASNNDRYVSILNLVDDFFKRANLSASTGYAISFGTPGVHQKPVVQVMSEKGNILGYARIGWNAETIALLQNEAQILSFLSQHSPQAFSFPEIINYEEVKGCLVLFQSSPSTQDQPISSPNLIQYCDILGEFAQLNSQESTLENTPWWDQWRQKSSQIQNLLYRHKLKKALDVLEMHLIREPLPFHFSHGDLVPWNMKWVKKNPFIFDWEYGKLLAPPGWDLFHLIIRVLWRLKNYSPAQTVAALERDSTIVQLVEGYFRKIKVDRRWLYPLFLAYITDQLAFYASREPFNSINLRYLTTLLDIIMYCKLSYKC